MKTSLWVALLALAGSIALIAASSPREQDMPKPGKEHELLKQFEGEWNAAMKFIVDPGQPPMESKGTQVSKVELGGFWLTSVFKGEMLGQPFEGRSTMGYSPMKKKFVGTWVDNFMPHLFTSEGDADAAGRVFTMIADGVDMSTGKPAKERWVMEFKDKDTQTMTFFGPGADGKERKTGEIVYTRKK